jgi:chromosome segregation ATPase
MSSRSNSSARNRRAGPNPNIQDTLTSATQNMNYGSNNYSNISSMQQNSSAIQNPNDKQEHKLLSITQAFMLINGKIRNLENQVDTMTKIIETHDVTKSHDDVTNDNSITPQAPNYEEMSDVSEFKQNMEDDFYDQDSKTSKMDIGQTMIQPSVINSANNNLNNDFDDKVMFDENKAREVAQDVTSNALQSYDEKITNLDTKNSNLEEEYNKLNNKTSELSIKLNSIEDLIKNIESLNTKLPNFMESVESRFENFKLNNSSNELLVRDTMSKVDNNLSKYNDKIENVQTSMSNMQEYAVSLHNLVIKRFDSLVEEKYIPKPTPGQTDDGVTIEEKGKKVLFDMKKNESTEIENCLDAKNFSIPEYSEDDTINDSDSIDNHQEVETMNSETLESEPIYEESNKKKKRKNKNTMKLEVDSEEQSAPVSA